MKPRCLLPASSFKHITFVVTCCAIALSTIPAHAYWHITLDGADITGPAAPLDWHKVPGVNIMALAPALGLSVIVTEDELALRDLSGIEWRARNGDASLTATGRSWPLSFPLLIQGTVAYLPLDAIAEIAGLRLKVDSSTKQAGLGSSQREAPPSAPEGWEGFTLEKPATEQLRPGPTIGSGSRQSDLSLPPNHDRLRLGFGFGYVQGADWGTEVTVSGRIRGVETSFGTLVTFGQKGLKPYSGHLSLLDRDYKRSAEAGDLFSEVWGLARGVRYAWQAGPNRWPSISLYLQTPGDHRTGAIFAYRDELELSRELLLGGELASNGSLSLRARFQKGRLSFYGYHRKTPLDIGRGSGAFVSYNLTKQITLYGTASRTFDLTGPTDRRSISVRFPIVRGIALTLENTLMASPTGKNNIQAAMAILPVGHVNLLLRYQSQSAAHLAAGTELGWFGFQSQELMASACYLVNSRFSLNYQTNTRYQDGDSSSWRQLVSSYRMSSRTRLQMISAFPNLFEPDQLRLRLSHNLDQAFGLTLDYGRLAPYQGVGAKPGARGFMIMLNKSWDLSTPARGGEVKGRVVDQLGRPLPGATVRLGGYWTMTDDRGQYAIHNIPSGTYEVRLDDKSMPADYKADTRKQDLEIDGRSRFVLDLHVIPLNAVTGRVYLDKNNDGKEDAEEAIEAVAVLLDNFPTATDRDGSFGFYNVEPGAHTVKLVVDRLPSGCTAASPAEVVVDLPPDKPISGITFRLIKQEKEIEFQTLH